MRDAELLTQLTNAEGDASGRHFGLYLGTKDRQVIVTQLRELALSQDCLHTIFFSKKIEQKRAVVQRQRLASAYK